MAKIKISELPELDIATLDTTYVAGVYNGATYKIPISKLTSSLDTTFATDLVTSALSSSLNSKLSTSSYSTDSASFNSRIISGSSVAGTISGSAQISALGFVTGSYTTITSFNSLTQSFNSISQSFNVISGSIVGASNLATTASNTFIGNQTISGSTYISGGLEIKNNGYSWSFDSNGKTRIPNITFNSDRGTGMVGIKTEAGREFQIETSTTASSAGPWVFGLDGTLSAPNGANILRVGNLLTTESFNSFTQSYYSSSASFDNRIDGLENATSSYLTSLNGAISSSAQILNGSGIYSSSAQINGNIYSAGSSFTIQDIIVGAGTTFGKITTDGSKYISVMPTYNIESSRFWANGNVTIQDGGNYVDNGFRLEVSGSTRIVGSFNTTGGITGSTNFDTIVNKPTLVSGSSQLTSSLDGRYLQSGSSLSSDSITFNRTAGINVTEGQMAWNNSDGTLDIGLNYGDVVLQVGQEQHYVVRNSTGTTIPNGTAVYASGVSVGSKRIEVSPFTANGTGDEIRFLGLATHNILDGVNGIVSNFGYVRGLDTRGTSATAISVGDETWAEGNILYAHPTVAGKLTKVAPKDKITVAMITTRHQTTGVLFVRPSSFGHIDDLHDVQINTNNLVTGSMLEWNGGYFVNNNTFSSSVDTRFDTLEATIISGSPNYIQILGNRRTNITTTGVSLISGSITTTGNPVQIMVTGDANPINVVSWTRLQIYRDETAIGNIVQVENSSNLNVPYCLNVIDTPSAGTYSYSMRTVSGITGVFDFGESTGPTLTAVELKTNTNLPSTNNTFTGTNTFNGEVNLNNSVKIGPGGGNEGGELALAYALTGNTLTGSAVSVDVYQNRLRIFEGGGNARGVYIDLSKAPNGVGGELLWKASGFVNLNTDVTLGNLKARIGNANGVSLQLSTVSGTYSVYGSGVYSYNGIGGTTIASPLTITTTPAYIVPGYTFTVAGANDTWTLMDTSAGIAWRITMIIGASFLNNFISIERLF